MLVYATPRALFSRVVDTGAYGWTLATLLALVTLVGYAEVKTGLIDAVVDKQTEKSLAQLEENQGLLIDRVELKDKMEAARKNGEFNKLMFRLGRIVLTPTYFLASFLIISAILYAVVALTGRKPEYQTLMSICVYSGFVLLVGAIVRIAMVLRNRTTDVDTSLAMLVPAGTPTPLVAVDPFRIWFWVLLAIGLTVTRQLSRRMAIFCCVSMGLLASGVRVAMAFAANSG
jgi:ABC-type Na+ efflux pump permease subunit